MTPAEIESFRRRPGWETAVRLRRWDDAAKVPGRPASAVDDFGSLLAGLADP